MFRRLALLLLVAAVAAGTVFAADLPAIKNWRLELGEIPKAAAISVKARDLNLVCPGSLNLSGGKAGNKLGVFSRLNTALLSANQNSSAGVDFDATAIETGTKIGSIPERISAPISITAVDSSGQAKQGSKLLAANQIQLASESTLSGLAGAQCQQPAHEQWLIGGDTTVGRESVLVLTNPSQVAATLDIEIFNQAGAVEAIGLNGFAVAPGQTQLVQLSSIVPRTKTFVVHITGQGGAIGAWIQQKVVRGLNAQGVDYIGPNPEFGKVQFVPGVLIRGSKIAKKLAKTNDDYSDLSPTVRVYVPGENSAKVTIQVLGSNPKSFGTVVQQDVVAGRVADISISGLADGDYVAIVSANVPIAASMKISRVAGTAKPAIDFALLAAATANVEERSIRVPTSGISKLSLVNAANEPASVQIVVGGVPKTISLQDAASAVIQAAPGDLVTVKSDQPVSAALVVDLDSAVTVLPLTDYKNLASKVLVSVR
jgi:Family of unknown function (DUF5719)